MSAQELIIDRLDLWTGAVTHKSGSGRGTSGKNGKTELTGIKKLRELILELAMRGKLVEQDPSDEPASMLLERIAKEKAQLVKEGKIKKPKKLPEITEEERPFDLPDNWTWARLGNITSKIGSGATPRGGKNAYTETGIPFLRSQNIWNDGLSLEDVACIPEKTHEKMSNTHVSPNDILLNITGASLGRCTVVPDSLPEANVSQHVTIIRTTESANRTYLHATMLSPYIQGLVWGRQVGMAREGLSKKVLELFEIPIPPEAEQHRIVEKVDELMALCDRLEQQIGDQLEAHEVLVDTLLDALNRSDNAEEVTENWAWVAEHFDTLFTTKASIDKLKQTILQLAVMGRLVEQDPNDEPVSALLERIAEEKAQLVKDGKIKKPKKLPVIADDAKLFELPTRWQWIRLGECSADIHYGYTASADDKLKEYRLLRITDIQEDRVNWTTVPGCEITEAQAQAYLLSENDILVARTGGTIGKSYLVENINIKSVFASYLIRIKRLETMFSRYLKTFLGSGSYWTQLYAASMGTGQPNVNGSSLKNLLLPLPPLNEQHRIVEKVDELMTFCDQLKVRLGEVGETRAQLAEAVVDQAVS
ncbi:restriction endonuclease subunit S [Halomonas sp. A40-4]|uniref:restriction endonuclease subunit S n=1 Tax=Halomonas sp. A40-4 TaxID=2785909 RepID=UPI0018F0336F|nr:restriction endonuclease subunit S [Halomonas sp. A40-4]QPL45337.1 restriction endonuclease subunit S [Halomonas sp. A40-4]